jgi:hypothetical protein
MPLITVNINLRSVIVIAFLIATGYLVFGKTTVDNLSVADAIRVAISNWAGA